MTSLRKGTSWRQFLNIAEVLAILIQTCTGHTVYQMKND